MRGEPEGLRLRTGAAEEETEVAGEEGERIVTGRREAGGRWRRNQILIIAGLPAGRPAHAWWIGYPARPAEG